MHPLLIEICTELRHFEMAILQTSTSNAPLSEAINWQFPAFTRQQLAGMATALADDVELADVTVLDPEIEKYLKSEPAKLRHMRSNLLPQIAQQHMATQNYVLVMNSLRTTLMPVLIWTQGEQANAIPSKIARRLRAASDRINDIEGGYTGLQEKIQTINAAHTALESLPDDIVSLNKAREHVGRITDESTKHLGKVEENRATSETVLDGLLAYDERAKKIIAAADEAYRASTTQGLASAFDIRAKELKRSMELWIMGLIATLIVGSISAAYRVSALLGMITADKENWSLVWLQLLLTALSVGAPLWFAWLATKQIGQHFRLSEDYAYKASVAKAYEGYRSEAAKIDKGLEARLFASALTRLEEAPLRFIKDDDHGSPWHELVSHSAFRKAMDTVPELKDAFVDIVKRGAGTVKGAKDSKPAAGVAETE